MSFKNHYDTLGISPQTGSYLIKKKFRKLAKQYHPDLNAGDELAALRFRELQEAYEILSNPAQRAKYDFEWNLHYPSTRHFRRYDYTPSTLLDAGILLNKKIAAMDKYRMHKEAVFHQINELVSESNVGIMLNNNDIGLNRQLIAELISASSVLPYRFTQKIAVSLTGLANGKEAELQLISNFLQSSRRRHYWDKFYPLIVLLIALTMCIAIYLACK